MRRVLATLLLCLLAPPAWAQSSSGGIANPGMYPTGAITPSDLAVYKDASGIPTFDPGIGTLSGRLVNVVNPVNPQDAATKSYVDGVATGLVAHAGARAATTANLAGAVYNNGTAGVGATLAATNIAATIDGVSLINGDRVLVKDMTAQADNGLYSRTDANTLTRTTDFDQASASEVAAGAFLSVAEGTTNAGTIWIETCPGPFTIGTTALCFTKLGATYSADGTTLQLSGNTFSLITPVTVPNGGTGGVSFAAHGPIIGEGTAAFNPMAAGTNGQLIVGQTSADPLWKTLSGDCTLASAGAITCTGATHLALTSAHLFVGSAGNVATDTALSGDCSITNAGVITCPNALGGTVTSVGLSVPATSIFGVTGSPVTTSGTLGLTTTGTSGGIPYFSSTSQLASSALLTTNVLVKGGGAGAAPTTSSITDNGTTVSTSEIVNAGGVGVTTGDATQSIPNNGTTAPVLHKLVILSAGAYTATIATTGSTTNVIGVCDTNCSTSGSATVAWAGLDSCVFDGATTAGDWVVASTGTAGDCHDGGSTVPTTVQVLGQVTTTNVGAGTYNVDLNPVGVASAINAKTSPGGTNGQIQFNSSGSFGGFTASGGATINTSTGVVTLGNPGASTLGGIESFAAVTHEWINTISTSGVPSATQPAIGDLANIAANTYLGNPTSGSAAPAATAVSGCSSSNDATQYTTNTGFTCAVDIADLDVNQSFTKGQAVTPTTGGSVTGTVTPDASTANDWTYTLTGNITLANPTNLKAGQTLNFDLTQDGSGSHTLTLGSSYYAAGGSATLVLSTAASAEDYLTCRSITTVKIVCNLVKAISH